AQPPTLPPVESTPIAVAPPNAVASAPAPPASTAADAPVAVATASRRLPARTVKPRPSNDGSEARCMALDAKGIWHVKPDCLGGPRDRSPTTIQALPRRHDRVVDDDDRRPRLRYFQRGLRQGLRGRPSLSARIEARRSAGAVVTLRPGGLPEDRQRQVCG